MKSYALILAAGSGSRMNAGFNKAFLLLRGVPVLARAIAPFSGLCAGAIVVARKGEEDAVRGIIERYGLQRFVVRIATGAESRQASVWNGLQALPGDAQAVLIHDGARALVGEEVIARVLRSVEARGSGVAALHATDTIKRADGNGLVMETLCRDELYAMQTPQGFLLPALLKAHQKAHAEGYLATDDAALLEYDGQPVYLCEGDTENIKLTAPTDLAIAEAILAARAERDVSGEALQ